MPSNCDVSRRTLALALGVVLATGCAPALTRVSMEEARRAEIRSARVVGVLAQNDLQVMVAPNYGFAVLGGAVAGAIRGNMINTAFSPVRDAVAGYDAAGVLGATIRRELAPIPWLQGATFEVRQLPPPAFREVAELVTSTTTDVMVLVRTSYALSGDFDAVVVTASVAVFPGAAKRAPPREPEPSSADGDQVPMAKPLPPPLYRNTFVVTASLPGFVREQTTREQAAAAWAASGGSVARRALDGALAEVARMIAFDLPQAGAGATPYQAPPDAKILPTYTAFALGTSSGFVVREDGGRSWVRLATGELCSVGEVYR